MPKPRFFVAKPTRTETDILYLSVDGFWNGAALARPEIKQSLTGWGDNCGSESSTLETDVCVWRYAPLVVHAAQEEEEVSPSHPSSFCGISKAVHSEIPTDFPSRASNKGGGKTSYFLAHVCQYLENGTRYRSKLLLVNRKLHSNYSIRSMLFTCTIG